MSQPSETSDPQRLHKQLASAANNRAWELSVIARTPEQDDEMLNAAHASAWHWSVIGSELNRMRATMLLAEVYASLGHGAAALRYAKEMQVYFLGAQTPDWELAFTHAICAHAASVAGDGPMHRQEYAKALAAMEAITDTEDKAIVAKTFGQVSQP
jgi:hypothetical protein